MEFENYEATEEEQTYAALVHALGIFGLIGVLINWFVLREKSPWVAEHVRRATNWTLMLMIVIMICVCTIWLIIPYFIILLTALANFIICILSAIKAKKGEMVTYPVVYDFIKLEQD